MYTTDITERSSKLHKFFTAKISLGQDKWLSFNRLMHYDGFDCDAIELRLVDQVMQTTTVLGTLCSGKWYSPNDKNASELWRVLKKYNNAATRALCKLSTPMSEFRPIVFEWNCFKRRFRLQSIKLKRKLRNA